MADTDNSTSGGATADVLVLGGIVITMDQQRAVLSDGGLAIRGNAIVALGSRVQIAAAYHTATVVDATGCPVIPGLIDAHTHIPMTLFRGLADDLPLHTWLEQHVWPAEQKFINPESVRCGSRLGVAELLRSGVTTLCDMYFYADEVAAAVDELGMRGVLANVYFDSSSASNTESDRILGEAEQFLARWGGHSRIVPALGPHAPYTVGPDLYRSLHALAERMEVPVVTHLAETQEEDRDIRQRYGRTPFRHLENLGLVNDRLVAAHCVWVDGREIDLLAAARTGVVHNPRSNLKLASGIAQVPDMLRAGVLVGLGTDGAASNNTLDLLGEIQVAALIHKGVRRDPLAVPATAALEMATIGGARALKLDHLVGSLELGKRADLVIIDLDADNLVPLYDPVSHLAYAVQAADVRTVIVDGRIVLQDRVLTTADEREIRSRVRTLAIGIGSFRGGASS